MNYDFSFISKWTVKLIQQFYKVLVLNTYFILSNLLLLLALFLLRPTMNNLVFFLPPIYGLLVSFMVQFKLMSLQQDAIPMKQYFQIYKQTFSKHWKLVLIYTAVIVVGIVEVKLLFSVAELSLLILPVMMTFGFLFSSMFYSFLISTHQQSEEIRLKDKLVSSLLISYKLPLVTLINCLYLGISFLAIQYFSIFYIAFLGGMINTMIWSNLQRKFSLELYFQELKLTTHQ